MNEQTWGKNDATSYPFTMPEGEIACALSPAYVREVYFHPKGYTDESYVGILLNKSAIDCMKLGRLTSNVPYIVKKGADISETVQIELRVCDEQEDRFVNSWFNTIKTSIVLIILNYVSLY